jgi:hypothetical protein
MVQITDEKHISVDIPGRPFCLTHSKEIAKKVCRLLELVTKCQDLKHWNRSTLKKVQQIVKLMHRIQFYGHTYPIPFENLEEVLGWNLAAWAVSENYKKQMALYKLRHDEIKRHIYGYWEDNIWISLDLDETENLLKDLTDWVTEPKDYLYNSKEGKYQQNPYNSQNNPPLFSTPSTPNS